MTRVALNALERRLDCVERAFEHLGEAAVAVEQAARDAVSRVVRAGGSKDAVDFGGHVRRGGQVVAAAIQDAVELHGIFPGSEAMDGFCRSLSKAAMSWST